MQATGVEQSTTLARMEALGENSEFDNPPK
jgi:hypothetical protein